MASAISYLVILSNFMGEDVCHPDDSCLASLPKPYSRVACYPLQQAVLNDNAQVDKGENARLSSFVGAIAIADLVKTTLGPKGQMLHVQTAALSRSQRGSSDARFVSVDRDGAITVSPMFSPHFVYNVFIRDGQDLAIRG